MEKASVRLVGGLGNYMFQIAACYAYSLKYNKQMSLTLHESLQVYEDISIYYDNIFSNLKFSNHSFDNYSVYDEPRIAYNEIPNIRGNVCLKGFFHTEKHFKEYTNEVKKIFSFPKEYIVFVQKKYKDLLNKNTCSIHIRRGDYLKFKEDFCEQNFMYYNKAISKMPENTKFLVFSNDIEWCKKIFTNNKFICIENSPDYETLLLMSLCKNNIIYNSSFSWWGAWLNNNPNKIVIAPERWLKNTIKTQCVFGKPIKITFNYKHGWSPSKHIPLLINYKDITPDEWLTI